MIYKVIDGITDFLYKIVMVVVVILGIHSFYELIFKLDIPVGFSMPMMIMIISLSYFATAKDEETEAVPVMIIKGGKPASVKGLVGGNNDAK